MDNITFKELLDAEEYGLILADGLDSLTPEQQKKLKEAVSNPKRKTAKDMSVDLSQSNGYKDFVSTPIMKTLLNKNNNSEPNNQKIKKSIKNKKSKKNPKISHVSSGSTQNLKVGDSEADILGKFYNLIKERSDFITEKNKTEERYRKEKSDEDEKYFNDIISVLSKGKLKAKPKLEKEEKQEKVKPEKKESDKKDLSSKIKTEETKELASVTKKVSKRVRNKPITSKSVKEKIESPNLGSSVVSGVSKTAGIAAGVTGAVGASEVIAKEEGVATKAYWDPRGQHELVSIGYGHQITNEEYEQGYIQAGNDKIPLKGKRGIDTVITKDQAQKLLQEDMPKYEKRASQPLGDSWNKLNQNQKDALISYAYNTGSTKSLVKAGLKQAIDSGNTELAAEIIRDKGIKTAGGKYNKTLDERRHREASLFLTKPLKNTNELTTDKKISNLSESSIQNNDLKKEMKNGKNAPVTILNNETNIHQGSTTTNVVNKIESDVSSFLLEQYGQ